jgi:hypothetical protein
MPNTKLALSTTLTINLGVSAVLAAPVNMQIDAVEKRVGHVPNASANGIVMLRFTNTGVKKCTINFWCPVGKPILVPTNASIGPTVEIPGRYPEFGIAIALLKYTWTNAQGKSLHSGTYEVNESPLTLKAGESRRVMVPVVLPSSQGSYRLRVSFDNTQLKSAEQSFNNKYAISDAPDSFVHVQVESEVPVNVKE